LLVDRELSRAGTARLTVTAAALVLGLSAAALLPLLLPWQGFVALTCATVVLALLPFAALALARRRKLPLAGERARLVGAGSAVALLSVLALVPLFGLYRGQVRVLNLSDEPFSLWVDGRRVARVEPSSGESALAGSELTLPAGSHELRVLAEPSARELFRSELQIQGGHPHLFAPLSAGYCFSIERRAYGSALSEPLSNEPLEGDTPFWPLPDGISWFTPNPEPGLFETSGGTLSCLRQKRCSN
jgi:hypothetical protein